MMHETTADVRRDIEETRARVSRTLAELQEEVGSRRSALVEPVVAAKDRVVTTAAAAQDELVDFARTHPWYALGIAAGLGLLIGRTGVDGKAARGVAAGAKGAASATASGARSAAAATGSAARAGMAKAKGLVQRSGHDERTSGAGTAVAHDPGTGAIGSSAEDTGEMDAAPESGIMYRLRTGLVEVLGVDELLDSMRAEADRIAGPRAAG